MAFCTRRSVLSSLGIALPFGLGGCGASRPATDLSSPALRLRPFEEALREAFTEAGPRTVCRVEVGDSDLVRAGVQGCHNERPFAGFPAGCLRIVRTGAEPGPVRQGVRLYVNTVEVALTDGSNGAAPSQPLDFAALPPAPFWA